LDGTKLIVTLSVLGLAGFFAYEVLHDLQEKGTGCFVTVTDSKGNSSTCKYSAFTCDSSDASSGTLCKDTSNYKCSTTAVYSNGMKCNNGTPNGVCTSSSDPNKSNACSGYCNDSYMVTTIGDKKYHYQCLTCDTSCAIGSMANIIKNLVEEPIKAGWDFLKGPLMIALYVFLGILGLALLYFIFKWIINYYNNNNDNKASNIIIEAAGGGEESSPVVKMRKMKK